MKIKKRPIGIYKVGNIIKRTIHAYQTMIVYLKIQSSPIMDDDKVRTFTADEYYIQNDGKVRKVSDYDNSRWCIDYFKDYSGWHREWKDELSSDDELMAWLI